MCACLYRPVRWLPVLAWLLAPGCTPVLPIPGQETARTTAPAQPTSGQESARTPTPPASGGIGKAGMTEAPIDLLGGRLTIRAPRGAKVQARQQNIMAAPESEDHETRVVADAGPERLVLLAKEAFAIAGDDFEGEVRAWVARWRGEYRVEPVRLPAQGLRSVMVSPTKDPNRSDDATFIAGLFVASGDRTIQSLDVYVNAAAEHDLDGCKEVARRILMSVAAGGKQLRRAAGERRLDFGSKEWEIAVTVPQDTVSTKQAGPDFRVFRLIRLGRLGADPECVGVYIGGHPSFHPGARLGAGRLFGKAVEWHATSERGGWEALCELPLPHAIAHVWVVAPDDARRRALRETAETMRLVKPGDPPAR